MMWYGDEQESVRILRYFAKTGTVNMILKQVEEPLKMKPSTKKVSDMTVEELKSVIHEVIAEDMEAWRETLEIMADRKLMKQIKQADLDGASGTKDSYISWEDLRRV